jgi:hypothetical protein
MLLQEDSLLETWCDFWCIEFSEWSICYIEKGLQKICVKFYLSKPMQVGLNWIRPKWIQVEGW